MRIRKAAIDGYGCFRDRTIEFDPCLQVIVGPNEQGKSTLRCFIGDVLYGQKRSTAQRLYDASNELRRPWNPADPEGGDSAGACSYGGRLFYVLDNDLEIEVSRIFDKENETVQVFDRTNARDVSGDFPKLRNREPTFAQAHLGISKEVFLNTATISYMTLEGLGDSDALASIREKLLSLTDSGEEHRSADAALECLRERIATIGQTAARTRPLPKARARLIELNREYDQAQQVRRELAEIDERRQGILEETDALRRRLRAVEVDLDALERIDRAERLAEAEGLVAQRDALTPRCFELREAEHFPLEARPEFQRLEIRCTDARERLDRSRHERERRQQEVAEELERLGQGGAGEGQGIPEDYDRRLDEIEAKVKGLGIRLREVETMREEAQGRLDAAERELASLPDFSRLPQDPVSWLGQLATSFRMAQNQRDEECEKRRLLREKTEARQQAITGPEAIFAACPDFGSAAREYEVKLRVREEQIAELDGSLEGLETVVEEYGGRVPGLLGLCVVSAVLLVGFLALALVVGNPGFYVVAALTGVASIYFAGSMVHARVHSAGAARQLDEAESKIIELKTTEDPQCKAIEDMLAAAQCQTVREIEAQYDCYRKARMELDALLEAREEQEAKADEAERQVADLLASYRERFCDVGEDLETEADVESARGRATARYQGYRDAKRRTVENREQVERHAAENAAIQEGLGVYRKEEVELGLKVRQLMRENGYPEEGRHDNVTTALRSYRIRSAQLREKRRGLEQGLADMEGKIEAEQQQLAEHTEALSRCLEAAGVDSAEQWHERAGQAEEYGELRQRLETLNHRLEAVLRGEDLMALREAVEADGPPPEQPQDSAEELKRRREDVIEDLDAHMKEEHALHLKLTERAAGTRSLNEIEEERMAVEARVRELERETEAASHAMALIEEIAQDKHARIAPRLAERASAYLGEITADAYNELLISRGLDLSIRIPATQRMSEDPERVLSKGTVDQIYLALRLAMVQGIGESGESVPMILDDPFANYDDTRLERALDLLTRVAETNQILLFTCRDDVARAAKAVGAPLLEL